MKSALPGFRNPLGKCYIDEPIVLFKSEIFYFYVVMLLASPETKKKRKELPKSLDKCYG